MNNKKTIFKILKRKYKSTLIRGTHFFDSRKDKKICGCSLVKYVPSLYRETFGATGSEATCYWALEKIFGDYAFDKNDSFIDIGCGKGRVLAFMQSKGYPCRLTGIELNKDVAAYAQNWASRYDNITILNGNAFELDYNDYSVLFMGRPFETETFCKFIDMYVACIVRPVGPCLSFLTAQETAVAATIDIQYATTGNS